MKLQAPTHPAAGQPSAVEAIRPPLPVDCRITDRRPSCARAWSETTYTVGQPATGSTSRGQRQCQHPAGGRARAYRHLNEVRASIEPCWAGLDTEKRTLRQGRERRHDATTLGAVWYGLRPAFVNGDQANIALQAGWVTADRRRGTSEPKVPTGSSSPERQRSWQHRRTTYNWTLALHRRGRWWLCFLEWGTKGDPKLEVQRLKRAMTAILTTSWLPPVRRHGGRPSVAPIGKMCRELN